MGLQYPLFALSHDDNSIRILQSQNDLNWYEKVDIEQGHYAGWDSSGLPFRIVLDKQGRVKISQTSDKLDIDHMRQAILRYIDQTVRQYSPDKVFIYDRQSNDFIGIISDMRKHLQNVSIKQKLVNFFRRF